MRKWAVGGCRVSALAVAALACSLSQAMASAAGEAADSAARENTLHANVPDRPLGLSTLDGRAEPAPAGNPLWAVPLRVLTATRERPLFSPSRRPPPAAVAAAPSAAAARPPAQPAAPDHPLLTLLGTVIGTSEGIGVFVDEQSKAVIHLKNGQEHGGWTLLAVERRKTTFRRGALQATLTFPRTGQEQMRDGSSPPSGDVVSAAAASPAPSLPAWLRSDTVRTGPALTPTSLQSGSQAAAPLPDWLRSDRRPVAPPPIP
jgi:hypothetical protein